MSPPSDRTLGHNAALDGLRAVSILGVMSYHLGLWRYAEVGQPAMDLFFALSGFLITSVLVGEKESSGRISIPRFYARRALRLLPALAFFLAVWLAVIDLYGDKNWVATVPGSSIGAPVDIKNALQGVGVAFAYVFNWFSVYPLFRIYIPLGHLWSLSVEEQFYLFWAPILLVLSLRRFRRYLLPATASLAVLSLLEPFLLWSSGTGRIYFGTDTRAGVFLLGAVAAMLWRRGHLQRATRGALGATLALASTAVLVLEAFWEAKGSTETSWLSSWILASIAAPYLVAWVVERSEARSLPVRILSNPVMVYIGKRCYGLYLWHYVIITWTSGMGAVRIPFDIAVSFACAEISWRLIETPALSLKKRLSPRASLPTSSSQKEAFAPFPVVAADQPVELAGTSSGR